MDNDFDFISGSKCMLPSRLNPTTGDEETDEFYTM